jgi:hypothetical protein
MDSGSIASSPSNSTGSILAHCALLHRLLVALSVVRLRLRAAALLPCAARQRIDPAQQCFALM